MTTIDNEFKQKLSNKYYCSVCDYGTCRKSNFDTHNNSNKHKNSVLTTNDNDSLVKISKSYQCQNCDKEFNDRAGLWRHNKKCCVIETHDEPEVKNNNNNVTDKDDLINYLIKENQEFKNLFLEILKKDTYIKSKTNITNKNTN